MTAGTNGQRKRVKFYPLKPVVPSSQDGGRWREVKLTWEGTMKIEIRETKVDGLICITSLDERFYRRESDAKLFWA